MNRLELHIVALLLVIIVALIILLNVSCYAEFDSVKTQPTYAPERAYIHWPAPPAQSAVQNNEGNK